MAWCRAIVEFNLDEFDSRAHKQLPWVPEDIFFLIDTDGSRRGRVNEAQIKAPRRKK